MVFALRGMFAGLLLMAALAGLCAPAAASPYEVAGVAVSDTADNAVDAKARAIVEGQSRALRIVLQRITRSADHARLPKVAPEKVQDYIAFFGLQDERTSATTYTASLNFRFEPSAVQDLLQRNGISYVDEQAQPVLVVPVFRKGEQLFLMDDNPVLEAWRSFDVYNTLTPVRLPENDVTEHGVDAEAVLARDPDAMSALRYLYRTDSVLVALCETDAEASRYNCSLRGDGPAGPVDLAEGYAGGSDPLAVAQAATGNFLGAIKDQWKERGLTGGFGQNGASGLPVPVRVSFSGLAEWQDLRARLVSVPGVSQVDIVSLNARGAMLSVYYAGTGFDLSSALAGRGLNLSDAGTHWVLQAN